MTDAPQESESPAAAGPIAEQTKTDSAFIVPQSGAGGNDGKAVTNLKAAFALAGHAAYELPEGGFLVINPNWNGVRHCRDIDALRAFARMVGAELA